MRSSNSSQRRGTAWTDSSRHLGDQRRHGVELGPQFHERSLIGIARGQLGELFHDGEDFGADLVGALGLAHQPLDLAQRLAHVLEAQRELGVGHAFMDFAAQRAEILGEALHGGERRALGLKLLDLAGNGAEALFGRGRSGTGRRPAARRGAAGGRIGVQLALQRDRGRGIAERRAGGTPLGRNGAKARRGIESGILLGGRCGRILDGALAHRKARQPRLEVFQRLGQGHERSIRRGRFMIGPGLELWIVARHAVFPFVQRASG